MGAYKRPKGFKKTAAPDKRAQRGIFGAFCDTYYIRPFGMAECFR
jgi:hypothetical protein